MVPWRTFNIHGTISNTQKVIYSGNRFFKLWKCFLHLKKVILRTAHQKEPKMDLLWLWKPPFGTFIFKSVGLKFQH